MLQVSSMGCHSATYLKYRLLNRKVFMTMDEAEALSRDLAIDILAAGKPDLLVGIANGALLPTKVVADYVGLPFRMIHVRRRGTRYKQKALKILNALHIPTSVLRPRVLSYVARRFMERHSELEHSADFLSLCVRGKSVTLVDDAMFTGSSLRHVQDHLTNHGATKVTTAVLCWYKGNGDSGNWSPDIYLVRQDHYYPWSYSSPYLHDYLNWLAAHGLAADSL